MSEFISYKERALTGLSADERQELLAAAGSLGLSNDDDPFWIVEAQMTAFKSIAAASAAAAITANEQTNALLAEAKAITALLKPSTDLAIEQVRLTAESAQANLTAKTAAVVGKAVAAVVTRQLAEQEQRFSIAASCSGLVVASVAIAIGFMFGVVLGHNGWSLAIFPAALESVGPDYLIPAQVLIVAGLGWWLLKGRKWN